jgi:hypothetical protein
MRAALAVLALSLAALIAGCASPADEAAAAEPVAEAASGASPEPVDIHEVVPLVEGGEATWTFDVEPGATTVEMRFFATGKAVAGTGLPTCLTIETPAGQDTAGICQGGGANVQVAPYVVLNERVFYEQSGTDAPIGTYSFTLEAGPSATDFHAMVTVSYD